MKKLAKLVCALILPLGFAGCTSLGYDDGSRLCAKDNGDFYRCNDFGVDMKSSKSDPSLFQTHLHFKLLGEYTEQMAEDMRRDLDGVEINEKIAVSSFVYYSSSLNETSALGNQLAENFINHLQAIGLPVSDHKLADTIYVKPNGDFVLSRDAKRLNSAIDYGYMLAGTLVQNQLGVEVHARIINFKSKQVVASASKFLPNIVVNRLL